MVIQVINYHMPPQLGEEHPERMRKGVNLSTEMDRLSEKRSDARRSHTLGGRSLHYELLHELNRSEDDQNICEPYG